ncbi:solute carrier family 35 member B1-like isoform X1 [Schistocerca gregaria]|uniref:solute carrier family 35 member B1-like isoform X1 n=1 Tax=Schistocerca gregaria TaxID=7010 RepID=UPI00211DC4F2|nr:solute carrier family 35 member B1-like isoform X1 [Schistocerca gregaria]
MSLDTRIFHKRYSSSSDNLNPKSAKKEKLKEAFKLIFYATGIYASFILYGGFQEYLSKQATFGLQRKVFDYPTFSLFIQGISNLVAAYIGTLIYVLFFLPRSFYQTSSALVMLVTRERLVGSVSPFSYIFSSLSQMTALFLSYYALDYIDYPTQILAKSSKPIPVMLMGVVILGRRYTLLKYLTVFLITGGIGAFMREQDRYTYAQTHVHNYFGITLVLLSLLLDGVTGSLQDYHIKRYRPSANHLNFWTSFWIAFTSLFVFLSQGEFLPSLQFCVEFPSVLLLVAAQAICNSIGQFFIFRILRQFGPLTLSVITTSRKFFSILVSIIWFNHLLSLKQWMALTIVFVGLSIDIFSKSQEKRG